MAVFLSLVTELNGINIMFMLPYIVTENQHKKERGGGAKMSYTVRVINIQVYDKGHTILSRIKFIIRCTESKNWNIAIVSYEHF